jgi:hypothetical protein
MVSLGIPFKTADGHAELAARYNKLSQRHRTLLLLIDGRRTLDDVLALGRRAGVPASLIDDLVALGLVEVPMIGSIAPRDTVAMAPPVRLDPDLPWRGSLAGPGRVVGLAPAALMTTADPADLTQIVDEAPEVDLHDRPTDPVPLDESFDDETVAAASSPVTDPFAEESTDGRAPMTLSTPVPWADSEAVPLVALAAREPAPSSAAVARASRHEARMARARGLLIQALREDGAQRQSMTMLRVRRARSVEDMLAVSAELVERLGRQGDLFDGMALVEQARRLLASLVEPPEQKA